MQHTDRWRPSKYVRRKGQLRASTNANHVAAQSWLIADLVAGQYDKALPQHAKGRLLDYGCGLVPLYDSYVPWVDSIVCVDWAASIHDSPHLDIVQDLSRPLALGDASFDTIIASDVLEHMYEPRECWREFHRLLASGGRVLLNVPFAYGLHEQPHDYFRYTEFALYRMAEDAGFKVHQLETIGGALDVIADITAKTLGKRPAIRWLGTAVQRFSAAFGRTAIGSRFARKTARRLPLGYFMVVEKP